MVKADKLLEKAEKELQIAKEKGQIPESIIELMSELRVHQTELEMQNEELKQSQEELSELYNRYYQLYNDAPVGYFTLDKEGIIRNVNTKGAELLGLEKKKIIGRGFSRFMSKCSENKYYHSLANAIDTGETQEVEIQLQRNKILSYAHMEIMPLSNRDNKKYRIIITDITKRRRIEGTIKENEEKYSTLFNNTSDGVWIHNLNGEILEVNDAYCKMSGYSRDELTRMPISKLEAVETPEEIANHIKKVIETDGHDRFESQHQRKDGSIFDVDITSLYFDKDSGKIAIFVRDITKRKQAEGALHEANRNYQGLFNNKSVGLAHCKTIFNEDNEPVDYVVLDINETYERLTGIKRAEIVNKRITEVVPGVEQSLIDLHNRVAVTGEDTHFEIYEPNLDHWYEVTVYSPEKGYFIAIFTNITEHKKAEEARLESDLRLNLALGSGNIGVHEWNPVTGELIWDERLRAQWGLSPGTPVNYDVFMEGIHHDDREKTQVEVNKALDPKNGKYHAEYRVIGIENAIERWIAADGQVFFEDNQPVRLVGTTKDITKNKKLEEELRKAHDGLELKVQERTRELSAERQRFFDVLETLPVMICLLTPDYHVAFANRSFREKFGEPGGRPCHEYCFGLTEPCDFCEAYNVLETGEPHHWEVITPDGAVIDAYDFPFTDIDGSSLILEMDIDITERRKAEERIEEQNLILEGMNKIFKEAITQPTREEFGKNCLKIVEEITGSEFSFIGEINSNGKFDSIAVSENGLNACEMVKEVGEEAVNDNPIRGIRSRAIDEKKIVIFNNPSSSPYWSGLPEGHLEVTSFMGIPLIYEGETIGLLALANKKEGYTLEDEENMNLLSAAITESLMHYLARKKLSEYMESLRLSNIYNRSLIEVSLDPLVTIGHDGKITDVNGATEAVTGLKRGELIGTDFSNYFTDPEKAQEGYKRVFKEGKVIDYHLEIQSKDGHITPVLYHASVYKDGFGEVIGVFAAARDITKRKKAEEELKLAYIYNRSLIEASLDPLVTIAPDGKITDVNTATGLVTGYSRDELIGTDFSNYFTEHEKAKSGYQRVFMEGEVRDYELEIRHRNGHITPVLYHASVYKNENGEVIGIFAAARDITERKEAEKILKETITELKRSNNELQQFAYITSHDLQEPLRTIASFTQLLEHRYKGQLDEDADEYIDFVVRAATRMKEMIQGLLEYSRVGTRGGEFKPTNTKEVVRIVLSNLHAARECDGAEITHDNLPTVTADKNQLIQLFQNLIGNAIKFKKPEEPPKIHISAIKDEKRNEFIFKVADNGIGMESQYGDKIFEVFKRLHTLDKYKGTGIGLSIAKRIIERHEGHIWVESELDEGSTFYFTVPIKNMA